MGFLCIQEASLRAGVEKPRNEGREHRERVVEHGEFLGSQRRLGNGVAYDASDARIGGLQ